MQVLRRVPKDTDAALKKTPLLGSSMPAVLRVLIVTLLSGDKNDYPEGS
jgi:hypothetical protein